MSLLRYILEYQKNEDGSYTISAEQMRKLRVEWVTIRKLSWRLMREFKKCADKYLIKTRWNRPYRNMKAWFADKRTK